MKKYLVFQLLCAFTFTISVSAQKNKIRFHSINTFELISGQSGYDIGFQTVNGIRFSNWYCGIGVGVDKYHYKTLPLFADARKFFGAEKKAFFYGDIGYNFPMKDKPGKEILYYPNYHFTGGIYTDVGMGYELPLCKKTPLAVSIGYSYKKLESKVWATTTDPVMGSGTNYSKYDLVYGRIIVKAGFIF